VLAGGLPPHPRLVVLHPLEGRVVPLTGLVFVVELPVGHGQEEPLEAATAVEESVRLFQGRDGTLPVFGAVTGYPQPLPTGPTLPNNLTRFPGPFAGLGAVAQSEVRAGGEKPG